MRELQLDNELENSISKPKPITGSAYKYNKFVPIKYSPLGSQGIKPELNTDISGYLNQSSSDANMSAYDTQQAALNRSASIQGPQISAEIFNF